MNFKEMKRRYTYIKRAYRIARKTEIQKQISQKITHTGGIRIVAVKTCALIAATAFLYFCTVLPDIESNSVMSAGFLFSILIFFINPWKED